MADQELQVIDAGAERVPAPHITDVKFRFVRERRGLIPAALHQIACYFLAANPAYELKQPWTAKRAFAVSVRCSIAALVGLFCLGWLIVLLWPR